jgi:hypothetical protein
MQTSFFERLRPIEIKSVPADAGQTSLFAYLSNEEVLTDEAISGKTDVETH